VAVVALLLGCGTVATRTHSEATLAGELRPVTYGPYVASYRVTTHGRVEQDFGGQTTTSEFTLGYYVSVTVLRADDAFRTSFALDSIVTVEGLGISPTEAARASGTIITASLDRDGRIGEIEADRPTRVVVERILNQLKQFFPRIPPQGVLPGERWSDTTKTTNRANGLDVTIEATEHSEAAGWTDYGGARALRIHSVSSYTVSGGGTQQGQRITLEGQGTSVSDGFLGPDGRYLGMVAVDTTHLSAMVEAIGAVIPITQTRTDTVTILP
jgi:hypothetical protein